MTKIRLIRERLDDEGRQIMNPFSNEPLVNGGSVSLPDGSGKIKLYFPGDTVEVEDRLAVQLVKQHPLTVETLANYEARMLRIRSRQTIGEDDARRMQLQHAMEQSQREVEAADKLRAMQEARDLARAQGKSGVERARQDQADREEQLREEAAANLDAAVARVQAELQAQREKERTEDKARFDEMTKQNAELVELVRGQAKPASEAVPAEPKASDASPSKRK